MAAPVLVAAPVVAALPAGATPPVGEAVAAAAYEEAL
jgi:hypothetical protein